MQADTIFDLSSLTKPLATTTAIMLLMREGKIRLDDRVTRFFPNFGVHGKIQVTIRTCSRTARASRAGSRSTRTSSASRSRAA
jgi:CubicO group peptidase (beta-lactamase class C family)